jgi:chromosome segregation ATPase
MSQEENNIDSLQKARESHLVALENLFSKARAVIGKLNEAKDENKELKEGIKELNSKITDLKLQLTKLNSLCVLKDKEISDLKNTALTNKDNNNNNQDRDEIKSRIKELISRIDSHLEEAETHEEEYE